MTTLAGLAGFDKPSRWDYIPTKMSTDKARPGPKPKPPESLSRKIAISLAPPVVDKLDQLAEWMAAEHGDDASRSSAVGRAIVETHARRVRKRRKNAQ
ncbi:MAG: hypothetical protein JWO85_2253 [Candidatus Eremiobacteraeota bacterium]|nr:hypothetical protein [Candidatus Eremiobacteraeota bacterium]